MKVSELYTNVLHVLESGNCDSSSFDALCLLEDIGEIGRGNVFVKENHSISEDIVQYVLEAAKRRANGEPLQYILGTWDFLNLTLKVGEGVLIPRPETELLCQAVAERLQAQHRTQPAIVWDLCAGSGCVGMGIATLYPFCEVLAVEVSSAAISYLKANLAAYSDLPVNVYQANILTDFTHSVFDKQVDVIVSNPPYIPTCDLPNLQREVKREPSLALDGGEDGYHFYRAITEHWVPKLSENGLIAVEVGFDQSHMVAELFRAANLVDVTIIQDYAGIDRMVLANKSQR